VAINQESLTMANISRRNMLHLAATTLGGIAAWVGDAQAKTAGALRRYQPSAGPQHSSQGDRPYWEKSYSGGPVDVQPLPPGLPGKHYQPAVIPNGAALPFKVVDGVKVFHLIAEEMDHAFDSGLQAKCWGYNGRVNSTVIEAVEGERVRIYVTNRLPVATSIHWHGIYLPSGMDGVSR
jgi:FtsP/CotA-like multicopper oxidase with cupredoxin domain